VPYRSCSALAETYLNSIRVHSNYHLPLVKTGSDVT